MTEPVPYYIERAVYQAALDTIAALEAEVARLRAHQHCATTEPPGVAARCVLTVLDALHDERTRLRAALEAISEKAP